MVTPSWHEMLNGGPYVHGDVPGSRSAELLCRQSRREPNARLYPRHLPIAIGAADGSVVRDVDGNVFPNGVGAPPLGHSYLELVQVVTEQLGRLTHGLTFPTPAKDALTDAQLSILLPVMRSRMKEHCRGPIGANMVDAALKLCKTATGRCDVISFQGGFHGTTHAGMALSGPVSNKTPAHNGVPGVHVFPYFFCSRYPVGLSPQPCTNSMHYLEWSLQDPNGGMPLSAAVVLEMVQGEGCVVPVQPDFVQGVRALTRALDITPVVDELQAGYRCTGTWCALEQCNTEPDVIIASRTLSGIGAPVAITLYDERLDVGAPGAHTRSFRDNQPTFATRVEPSKSSTVTTCWATYGGAVTGSLGYSTGSGTTQGCARNVTLLSRTALCDLASDTAANARGSSRSSGIRHLHRFFEVTSDRVPDKIALEDGDRRVTYRELDEEANQLAHFLRGLGIGRGSRVGILLHRSSQTYVSLLAILKADAAFVPIDPGSPRDRVAYIADDSELDLLITSTGFAAVTVELGCPLLKLDRFAAALGAYPVSRLVADEEGDPPCYVIYTSGSSGRPKGVEIAQSSICNFIGVVPSVYDVRQTDRVYQGMTIAFDFSIEEIWPTFAVGATLVVGPNDSRRLGSELGDFLDEGSVTVFYCVPTLLATVNRDLPTIRSLIVGGEACPAELVERWSAPGRRILNTYGPTEATVTATCGELRPGRPVTIGRALPTYDVVLLDSDLQPVPAGDVGEICIGGPGVARGYLGRPDLTADRFVRHRLAPGEGRLYRTGDLGRLLDNGEFEYCGRADTQVKIAGYRVELTEIESVLAQTPGIAQAVVDTYESEPGLVELVGYYSLRNDTTSVYQQRVYQQLRERLPTYMVPAYLEQLTVIPMLPSGKADRNKLPPPKGPRSITPKGSSPTPWPTSCASSECRSTATSSTTWVPTRC